MNLPNPVIRSHYANGFIKQYVRDHLILRTEPASNNVKDYGVNKAVENLSVLRNTLSAITDNYLKVQQDILETFIDRGELRKLAQPTITSTGKRVPGLKLDNPRQLAACMPSYASPILPPPIPLPPHKSTLSSSRPSDVPRNAIRWHPCATISQNFAPKAFLPGSRTLAAINFPRRATPSPWSFSNSSSESTPP